MAVLYASSSTLRDLRDFKPLSDNPITRFAALHTRRIAESMVHFIRTSNPVTALDVTTSTGKVKLNSVLELAAECTAVNRMFLAVLTRSVVSAARTEPQFIDADEACRDLMTSAEQLAAVLDSLPDSALGEEFQHPRAVMRGDNAVLAAYRNMAYHCGQINTVQLLAGDTEFHVPPNWR